MLKESELERSVTSSAASLAVDARCFGFRANLRASSSTVYSLEVCVHKSRADLSYFSSLASYLESELSSFRITRG